LSELFVDLLKLGIASSIGPGQINFDTLLLLSSYRAILKAGFFVAGMTVVRPLPGIAFGIILDGSAAFISNEVLRAQPTNCFVINIA
jgi:hypothetical protein